MGEPVAPQQDSSDLRRGLPMVAKWDPEALAREKAMLAELSQKGLLERIRGYLGKTGPGWLQSALTLGAGSATSSLFAGALLGYDLTWVQPLGMLAGIIMFAAIAYQTLSTGVRPFEAMRRFVHPAVAWAWAIGSLVATVIWHFPQYSVGGAVAADIAQLAGWEAAPKSTWVFGILILGVSVWVTWLYGSHARGVKLYERVLKWMVWVIIVAFLVVIVRTGIRWGALWRGLTGFPGNIPRDAQGVEVMIGGLSACVGINMTFLFPYTLLAKGWGTEHRGLSKFDLLTGMWFPFVLATGFLVIAAANTLYNNYDLNIDKGVTPLGAAHIFADTMGLTIGRVVFGIGILGMVLSSITLHMVVSAFIICECLGVEPTGWRYRLASLLPIPGVLGTVFWGQMRLYLGVPTSAICGFLLPIAYIGFFILHNRRDYLGDETPRGARAAAWNLAMVAAIAIVTTGAVYYAYTNYIKGGGIYDSPKATVRHLKLMAEDGHKSRALACFSAPNQEKIRAIEKQAQATKPLTDAVLSYMDPLVDRLKAARLQLGKEMIQGNQAALEIQLDGEPTTVALVNEKKKAEDKDVWKITGIELGLPSIEQRYRSIEARLPPKKEEGAVKAQ